MSEATKIEWCDSTFNPWIGCTKVSPGCDNCYAAQQDTFRRWTPEGWGGPRKRTKTWDQPTKWNARPFCECTVCHFRGEAHGTTECPACRDDTSFAPARRRVFCASLADVFDNQVPPEWRAALFHLIEQTPNLDWLLLTKRIGNASDMMFHARGGHLPLLNNVWLGATVVNQEEADRDIPKLLVVPARVRFLSIEPMLGRIQLDHRLIAPIEGTSQHGQRFIDWVICGGGGRICFDHCHASGAFRGWLCHHCNLILGHAKDDSAVLRRLAKYLEAGRGVR